MGGLKHKNKNKIMSSPYNKYCFQCKWSEPTHNTFECNHPNNKYKNPVTGTEQREWPPSYLRYNVNLCGPEARWYEDRKDETT